MKSLLRGPGESVMLATIVYSTEYKVVVAAGIRGAVSSTPSFNKSTIGLITAFVLTVRRRAILSAFRVLADNGTGSTHLVIVVKPILDFFRDNLFRAVIVMTLHDEVVLLAIGRGAVGCAATRLEEGHGVEHGVRVGAIDVEPKLFRL